MHEESDKPGVRRIQDIRRPAMSWRITQRSCAIESISCAVESHWRDLEAKIESQKTEIQSLQRHLQSTQDTLNCWDEVNLNSIQGVYVDDSVGTSTSSASRNTAISIHLLTSLGGDPELFQLTEVSMLRGAPTFFCSSEYAASEHSESSNGCTQFFHSDDLFTD